MNYVPCYPSGSNKSDQYGAGAMKVSLGILKCQNKRQSSLPSCLMGEFSKDVFEHIGSTDKK